MDLLHRKPLCEPKTAFYIIHRSIIWAGIHLSATIITVVVLTHTHTYSSCGGSSNNMKTIQPACSVTALTSTNLSFCPDKD